MKFLFFQNKGHPNIHWLAALNVLFGGFNHKRTKKFFKRGLGKNFEKMVFSSPKTWILRKWFLNFEVSLRNWWVFSDLGIKFGINITKLSIFSPLKGAIALLASSTHGCATSSNEQLKIFKTNWIEKKSSKTHKN